MMMTGGLFCLPAKLKQAVPVHSTTAYSVAKSITKRYFTSDFIINTVSAQLDLATYVNLLRRDGTMILLGVPTEAPHIHAFNLIAKRRRIAGSLIGGIAETQEMLDFCAEHNIMSDVEVIDIKDINESYERMLKGDVKYRFVIDLATLNN